MNQKNQNIESYIQKPQSHQSLVSSYGSQVTLRRGSSLDAASVGSKRFSLKKDNQYQSMIEDTSVDSDGSNMTSFTTTTTASSASSPASTSLSRQQVQVTPAHQRQIQFKRRMQQQKLVSNAMMRIQHQSRSDQSSSDDGMPQSSGNHRIASGIHIAHNKTIAPAGLLTETIEMKNLPSSPPSSASSSIDVKHKVVKQEDSTKTTISTLSPTTVSSEREFTIETTLSFKDSEKGDEKSSYKRSRSFHGKG